jgi:hypothetical protein
MYQNKKQQYLFAFRGLKVRTLMQIGKNNHDHWILQLNTNI